MKVSSFALVSREGKSNSGIRKRGKQESKEPDRSVRNTASFSSALKSKLGCKSIGPHKNEWIEKWQISLSVHKGKAMLVGKNNWNLVYLMLSSVVAITSQERDLRVTVATPLKSMALWEAAAKNYHAERYWEQGRWCYSAALWNLGTCSRTLTSSTLHISTSWQDLTALKKLSLHLNYQGDEASALQEMGGLISVMTKLSEL